MKKVVVASLLAFAAISATGMAGSGLAFAQTAVNLGSGGQGGVTMQPEEFKAYDDAVNKQTTPQTQAPALEAYLKAYPQSAVKADVLQRLMIAYSSMDPAKTIDAADRLLQVDPNNLRALTFEVYFRKQTADAATDPAAKQAALDAASGFATKGLAATKPKDMPQADYDTLKATATPIFYTTIGAAALNKKDFAGAIVAYKAELSAVPPAATTTPGQVLQDTYLLGTAYYGSTPPDLFNCTWYATRAAFYAPEAYKPQLQPLASYCYKKYHGGADGYEAVTAAVQTSINPPASFSIVPAPTNEDIVAKTIKDTPDLATLALSDKEFIIQYGKPEDADKVFATVKGKAVEIPDAVVVTASDSSLTVSVSDDAVQAKTADFTFNMKTALKTLPAVGAKVTLTGTYASYTSKPLMIIMSDAEIVAPKKAAPVHKAPVHHK
ncbi:hypothetical protein SAMN05421770_102448 [Granulicella rosea]|uniref:Tetratricopeptide repeat-containing protein n=1 Tax=Granulicella rosea TaxID=474952 RepID=A0A239HP47_9BACT|nr:hypothetical protein [Granulicella rosea]SNS82044.1 hypothetical protein SAMN05421770_102448 [Granulicella rosea]